MADAELWKLVQEGNKEAFAHIYRSHASGLYRYGTKITKDSQLVEDTIQEIFCRLWELRNGISINQSIKFYLFTTFRRELIKSQSGSAHIDQIDEKHADLLSEVSLQEILVENQISLESHQKLAFALDALSKRQKEAIYLKYIEDLSYEEISHMMNIQIPSLYNLIFKALKFLKNHLLQNNFFKNIALLPIIYQLF
jgi:RNA polymerase sigma factor (sigma-70 family)